jgi:hypothetical protein
MRFLILLDEIFPISQHGQHTMGQSIVAVMINVIFLFALE